ncbi:MAG TPA: hypothetical protein VJT73_10305 [Polyangiaceae bacterium]|nr:hypothetical protein [Polyangiaceae bacterium]
MSGLDHLFLGAHASQAIRIVDQQHAEARPDAGSGLSLGYCTSQRDPSDQAAQKRG